MNILYFLIIISVSTFFSFAECKLFNAKEFTLDNGLKVIVIENKRAPVVNQMIWYNVGSVDEQYGKSGIAHFLEHLMFKGTKKNPGGTFSKFISNNGGSENAFTSFDYTAYYQTVPSEKIERVIELEADRMKNLTLTKKQIDTEKKVILEERYQRIDSDPSSVLDESMRKGLFSNHTYGRPIIGWKHEIESLEYQDVFDFYKKYYSPNNALVILSGSIDLRKAKELTKKYFGKIKNNISIEKLVLKDPKIKTSLTIQHNHPSVKQKIWKKLFKSASYKDSIERGIALDMGLKILAGGSTSILYEELVKKQQIVSSIGGYYQGMTRDLGTIYFYAIPNDGISIPDLEKKIKITIKDAIENKITDEKFNLQKKSYLYTDVYIRDSITKPAQIIGEALTIGLNLDNIENWNTYVRKLTLKDVVKELKLFMNNKNFVTGILDTQ